MQKSCFNLLATILLLSTLSAVADVLYVDVNSATPESPFTDWSTAATTIQDAIEAAAPGDVVLVTNGIYQTGGRVVSGVNIVVPIYMATSGTVLNRVAVTKAITVRSVNGPAQTIIVGKLSDGVSTRCVFMTNGARLDGFTLTNGFTSSAGGGAYCASTNSIFTNCIFTGNTSVLGAGRGGGVLSGTLNNCLLISNNATVGGGGAIGSVLNNCLLTGNFAGGGGGGSGAGAAGSTLNNCTVINNLATADGGGIDGSAANNCIIYSNMAGFPSLGSNYSSSQIVSKLNYCCTTPLPTNGVGNFTNDPGLINLTGGNFRLQTNSPCINKGSNTYVASSTDLDGRPRIVGGTVDIGAYEFQSAGVGEFIVWLQQHSLATDGSADHADPDCDGMSNWNEWITGTDPSDAASALQVQSPTHNTSGITVTWQSVTNRNYFVQSTTGMSQQTAFTTLASNIAGQSGTTTYTDTNAVGAGPYFYRVGVQP